MGNEQTEQQEQVRPGLVPKEPALTDSEYACLEIMDQGGILGPIGSWEKPVLALHARGFAQKHDQFNYSITEKGRTALKGHDQQVFGGMIQAHNRTVEAKQLVVVAATAAATHLAEAVRLSMPITGDNKEAALDQWVRAIRDKARELLQ